MNFLKSYFLFRVFLFFCAVIVGNFSSAQYILPDRGAVFKDDIVPRIDILIDQELLDMILDPENRFSDTEHPATFIFDNGEIKDTLDQIGFRLRGNTSRNSQKKSYKISINAFERGRDYKGLEKINLNGEHNDPSIIRSKICWDLLRNMGVPAPRANHVELYINGDYYGLYIHVEQIDEEFAEAYFGNKEGNLYKCLYPADLNFRGSAGEDYKHESGGRRVYDLKTNETEDNYDLLAQFIDVINNTPNNELRHALEPIFNVNSYLRSLAVEIITGHWDGYSYLKNNYYLYENPDNGKIEYIHFDMDNTLGIDWIGRDWANRNIYSWKNTNEDRPLFSRMMEVQEYRDRLSYYIGQLIEQYFKPEIINPRIDQIKALIQSSAEADNFRTLDYGYSINDFNNSYDIALGGHVAYGLKDYIQVRVNSALSQLESFSLDPVIWPVKNSPLILGEPIVFTVYAEDDNDFALDFQYSINGQEFQAVSMVDDGLNGDLVAGDGIFTTLISGINPPATLEYFVTAEDITGNSSREPVSENYLISLAEAAVVPLFINEFMADNEQVVIDEAGEYDDWFEIYNAGSTPLFLGDKYLTDDLQNPGKWKIPDIFITPGEIILFWADNDTNQGDTHTNFRLSKDGEALGLFYGEAFGFAEIHSVVFGMQETDVSEGLLPDGNGPFQVLPFATPGRSNIITGAQDEEPDLSLRIWPNPSSGRLNIYNEEGFSKAVFDLLDASGKRVWSFTHTGKSLELELSPFSSGVYVLKIHQKDRVTAYRILRF